MDEFNKKGQFESLLGSFPKIVNTKAIERLNNSLEQCLQFDEVTQVEVVIGNVSGNENPDVSTASPTHEIRTVNILNEKIHTLEKKLINDFKATQAISCFYNTHLQLSFPCQLEILKPRVRLKSKLPEHFSTTLLDISTSFNALHNKITAYQNLILGEWCLDYTRILPRIKKQIGADTLIDYIVKNTPKNIDIQKILSDGHPIEIDSSYASDTFWNRAAMHPKFLIHTSSAVDISPDYETCYVLFQKKVINELLNRIKLLKKLKKILREIRNYFYDRIMQITQFVRLEIYWEAPLIRSIRHYWANTFTIEKFIELHVSPASCNSLNLSQCHKYLSPKLFPISKR